MKDTYISPMLSIICDENKFIFQFAWIKLLDFLLYIIIFNLIINQDNGKI